MRPPRRGLDFTFFLMPAPQDYLWLVSDAAETLIGECLGDERDALALAKALRKTISAQRARLVLEQAELRRRGRAKFSGAERMFFTRTSLEQATDERIASYKAGRFAPGAPIADLCCGIGGDLLALAQQGATRGLENDEIKALFARVNAERNGAANCQVDAADAAEADLSEFAAWHIDPDRRPDGMRTTRVELHSPSDAEIDRLLARNASAAIKLAPAAEAPPHWAEVGELEWVSRGRECRQLIAWQGALARRRGLRTATKIDGQGKVHSFVGAPATAERSSAAARYVYDVDPAAMAARLAGALAVARGLKTLDSSGGYLTGDEFVSDGLLAAFEVQESLPLDAKRIKQALRARGIGEVEVKKRGTAHDPARLARELSGAGDKRATLLIANASAGVMGVIARRVAPECD